MPVNLELSAIFESHRIRHCDAAYIWYEWDLYLTTVSFQDGSKMALKNVTPGNSVFSMLGILDVLTVREETIFFLYHRNSNCPALWTLHSKATRHINVPLRTAQQGIIQLRKTETSQSEYRAVYSKYQTEQCDVVWKGPMSLSSISCGVQLYKTVNVATGFVQHYATHCDLKTIMKL